MSDELAKTFGEDFAQSYQQEVEKRRRQREEVSDEVMADIVSQAINGNKITPENPVFQYTTDEGITHDVALVTFPDPQSKPIWSYMNELDSGAVSIPFDYMDDWISCLFNDSNMLQDCDPGEMYLLAGEMDQWETDSGEINDQFSPVRGVVSLEEAREMADESMEQQGFSDSGEEPEPEEEPEVGAIEEEVAEEAAVEEEQEPEPDAESSSTPSLDLNDSGDDSGDLGVDDETYSSIANKVEGLAESEPEVWNVTEDDSDRINKLVKVICNQLDLADEDSVRSVALDRIEEGPQEDDDSDDEDSLFG